MGQGLHQPQLHHSVGQQLQGPVVVAIGRWATRQGDQVGLALIVQLAIPVGLDPILQHAIQTFLSVPPFGPVHRTLGHVQSVRNLGCVPSLSNFEQDARPGDDTSRTFAATYQSAQLLAFLRRQLYRVLFQGHVCHTSSPLYFAVSVAFGSLSLIQLTILI